MAVGDIVNGISGDNTKLDFQPASGVEIMITSCFMDRIAIAPMLFDGTNQQELVCATPTVATQLGNLKIFINNTNYLRLDNLGVGNRSAYTGIVVNT